MTELFIRHNKYINITFTNYLLPENKVYMRKKYKYEIGIAIIDGVEIRISRKDLEDEGVRVKYKHESIFDQSKEIKLHIRSRGKSSHFYSRGKNRKNISSNKYYNDKHLEKIDILVKFLKAKDRVRICTYYWDYGKKGLETIFSFKNYLFSKEVKQSITENNFFISDIYGISKKLNKSEKEPHISIEVIDTHYPSTKTFNYFRHITRNSPLIIILYYMEFEPFLNQMINIPSDKTNNGKLRVTHYIQDGSFWVGEERIEEKDYSFISSYNEKIDFENSDQYYNAVQELEINRIRKKSR